jgi:hypothetical protein
MVQAAADQSRVVHQILNPHPDDFVPDGHHQPSAAVDEAHLIRFSHPRDTISEHGSLFEVTTKGPVVRRDQDR